MAGSADNDIIQVAALGRRFKLGMLYDCRTDNLLPEYVWDESTVDKHTKVVKEEKYDYKVISSDNIKSRAEALEMCDRLNLSVVSGLVRVDGAAKYLNEPFNQYNAALKFKCTTKTEHINVGELKDEVMCQGMQDNSNGTHFVSSVTYGNQVFFTFKKIAHNLSQGHEDTQAYITELITKIPKICNKPNCFSTLSETEKNLAVLLSVETFADVRTSKLPCTYEDAIEVYKDLLSLFVENDKMGVPVSATLCPLGKLGQNVGILHDIRSIDVLDFQIYVENLEKLLNDTCEMMNTNDCQKFPCLHSEIQNFQQLAYLLKEQFIKDMAMLLPKIRSGEADEYAIDSLFKRYESSPCSFNEMSTWFQKKETEVTLLGQFMRTVPNAEVLTRTAELEATYMNPDYKNVFCLAIHRPVEDFFLKNIKLFLRNKSSDCSILHDIEKQVHYTSCETSTVAIRKMVRKFMELYKRKQDDHLTKFVVLEKNTQNNTLNTTIVCCRNGEILDSFENAENGETKLAVVLPAKSSTAHEQGTTAATAGPKGNKTEKAILPTKRNEVSVSKGQNSNLQQNGKQIQNASTNNTVAVGSKTHGCQNQTNKEKKKCEASNTADHYGPQVKSVIPTTDPKSSGYRDAVLKHLQLEHKAEMEQNSSTLTSKTDQKNGIQNGCTGQQSLNKEDNILDWKPCTPKVSHFGHDCVTLSWEETQNSAYITDHDVVILGEDGLQETRKTGSKLNSFSVSNLQPGKTYQFQVRCYVGSRVTLYSDPTELMKTHSSNPKGKPTGSKTSKESQEKSGVHAENVGPPNGAKPAKHISETAKQLSLQYIDGQSPEIYAIKAKKQYSDSYFNIRKFDVGDRNQSIGSSEKVLLLVGATGSGKSTLIDGIVNYVLGVSWKDDVRYKLTDVTSYGTNLNQAKSQTTWITSYTIHRQSGSRIPYTLTLVDTPGFGDMSGTLRDKQIIQQIRHFFSQTGMIGIDQIDAVGFVVQSSLPRLTKSQKYTYDSVLSVFGKNFLGNIFMLLTFSDGQRPQVLDSLKEADFPCEDKYFKFNNSALYATNIEPQDDDQSEFKFNRKFWKMSYTSYKQFLDHLNTVEPISLSMSKETLYKKQQLQVCLAGLQIDIQLALNKLDQLQRELYMLTVNEADITQNENYSYIVLEDCVEEVPIKCGEYTTNCLHCKRTCHYLCTLKDDDDKAHCSAMNFTGKCKICPDNCGWRHHKNLPYIYEVRRVEVKKTLKDIAERYRIAQGLKISMGPFVQQVKTDINMHYKKIHDTVNKIVEILKDLEKISLKPHKHLSASDCIETLIQCEKAEGKAGYEIRMEQLRKVRDYVAKSYDFRYQLNPWKY